MTASGDVSATDNVFASPREVRVSDISFAVRPGVLFGYDGPRASHELGLEGEVLEFVRNSEKPSVSLRGGLRTRVQTTRFTSFAAQLEGSNGVLSALGARSSPDVTGPQLVPLGRIDTQSASGAMALSWDTGRSLQITPSVFGRVSRSDDNADDQGMDLPTIIKSAETGGQISVERTWRENSLSFEAGAAVLRLERDASLMAMLGPRLDHQFNPRVRGQWRHDINRQWSSTLDGGAVYVHPFGKDPDNPDRVYEDGIFPVFGGALAYTEVWGRGLVQARREVAPNLLVAQNTVNDTATVQVALPLPWLDDSRRRQPKLVGLGSIGLARTQLINSENSQTESEFLVGSVDVGVGYSPRPGFTYGLRFQFQYQTGDDQAEMVIPGFWRNTLSFTFNIRYPDQANGEAARRRNRGVRADGGDLVPVGVDPVTTDVVPEDDAGSGNNE
ncbi:MAG: hypothetical protein H0V17_23690 [Deltaproteobacteria bacterium]|nr:hypothetical protein [Deltaproteobacteria bacterium]